MCASMVNTEQEASIFLAVASTAKATASVDTINSSHGPRCWLVYTGIRLRKAAASMEKGETEDGVVCFSFGK